MKTEIFDFPFDDSKIALKPLENRLDARLMVIDADQPKHKNIKDLPNLLKSGDVLVLNNTKVLKARLNGTIISPNRSAKCQVTLHKLSASTPSQTSYTAFVKGSKKLKIDDTISFSETIKAKVIDKDIHGQVHINFDCPLEDLFSFMEEKGTMPLPPYIEKHRQADQSDDTNYQTVFAQHAGSVAAPTASLHLTHELLENIQQEGVQIAYVTLHVSGGTFLPVKTDDITEHHMHSEIIQIDQTNADIINNAKANDNRIICVGTTSLRVVESCANDNRQIKPFVGETDIFIYPGYEFKICDVLMTNFHLPKSTLFMLVCAFSGIARMKNAYKIAQQKDYRFFSYGDACLLFKNSQTSLLPE